MRILLAEDDDETAAYVERGLAYFHKSQFQPAADDFSYAIRLKPDNADAWYQRATANAASIAGRAGPAP